MQSNKFRKIRYNLMVFYILILRLPFPVLWIYDLTLFFVTFTWRKPGPFEALHEIQSFGKRWWMK
jgi:hypothetical protein